MVATPPPLAPDLVAGLHRLKLGTMRRLAPELLVTAKTQRWSPEEFLRTLVDAEIESRDLSNARARLKAAAFPVTKTLEDFDVAASSIPRGTFDYLASLEWIAAKENPLPDRPRGHRQEPHPGGARPQGGRGRLPGPLLQRRRAGRHPLPGTGRQLRGAGHRVDPAGRRRDRRRAGIRPARSHRGAAALPVRGRRLRTPCPRRRQPLALRGVGPL